MTPASRRLAIARSTFRQAVFCTSTAPTMISNGESPGHQCCGPNAASNRSYTCVNIVDMRITAHRLREPLRLARKVKSSAKVKSEFDTKFFAWSKRPLLLFLTAEYNERCRHESITR